MYILQWSETTISPEEIKIIELGHMFSQVIFRLCLKIKGISCRSSLAELRRLIRMQEAVEQILQRKELHSKIALEIYIWPFETWIIDAAHCTKIYNVWLGALPEQFLELTEGKVVFYLCLASMRSFHWLSGTMNSKPWRMTP